MKTYSCSNISHFTIISHICSGHLIITFLLDNFRLGSHIAGAGVQLINDISVGADDINAWNNTLSVGLITIVQRWSRDRLRTSANIYLPIYAIAVRTLF